MARVGTRAPAPGGSRAPARPRTVRNGTVKKSLRTFLASCCRIHPNRTAGCCSHWDTPSGPARGAPALAGRATRRVPSPHTVSRCEDLRLGRSDPPGRLPSSSLPPSFVLGRFAANLLVPDPAGGGVRPPTPSLSEAPSRPGEHRPGRAARASAPGPAAERALAGHRPRRQPRRAASSTLLASSASQPARPATPACSSARPLTSGPIAPPTV